MIWLLSAAVLLVVIGAAGIARGGARSNRPFTKAQIESRCREQEGR